MRALILVADETPGRLCSEAAARAAAAVSGRGGTARIRDLDAEEFTVAMSPEERTAYETDEPILDPLVADHAHDVKGADVLVFCYHSVLSTMPARMKGWLDRVLVPGVGFDLGLDRKVRPGLTHVRRIVGISTYDQRRLVVKAEHDNGRRTMMRAVRMTTGWRTSAAWIALYSAPRASPAQKDAFLDRCARRVVR